MNANSSPNIKEKFVNANEEIKQNQQIYPDEDNGHFYERKVFGCHIHF